jgi:hypothetical protein
MTRAISITRQGLVEYMEVTLPLEEGWEVNENFQGRILDKFGTDEPYPVLVTQTVEQDRNRRNDLTTALAVPSPYRDTLWVTGDALILGVEDGQLAGLPERVSIEDIIALTEFFADH